MVVFKNEISIGDLIQFSGLLIATGGLALTALQTSRANRLSRAQQVIDLQGRFLADRNLVDTYYLIEYQQFAYDKDFHGSELEKRTDRLLQCFENIAMLFEANVIALSDLDAVAYNYLMIYQDQHIQRYFEWLDTWYQQRGMNEIPFGVFRKVGALLEKRRFHAGTAAAKYQSLSGGGTQREEA